MRGTRYPNAEEHPPSPPLKGGGGGSEALGEKRTQGSPATRHFVR